MQKTRKKQIIAVSAISFLIAAMIPLGVVLAMLTQNVESRANNFHFSNADIELIEEEWKKDTSERVVYPGAAYPKDPAVRNTGANDLYVYLMVKTPVATGISVVEDVKTGNDTREKITRPDKPYDLLQFVPSDKWALMIDSDYETDYYEEGYHVRVYAYKETLKPGTTTECLFNTVTFSGDIMENQPQAGTVLQMPVTAYAVQAEYLANAPENGTQMDVLKHAFETYNRQTARNDA